MFIQHKRNRRAVDRANMSSDYQKERLADREPGPANKYNRSQTSTHVRAIGIWSTGTDC